MYLWILIWIWIFIVLFLLFLIFLIEDKTEIGTEPMKFDGFCIRTFDEDIKWEEIEKNKINNPKKGQPKKK